MFLFLIRFFLEQIIVDIMRRVVIILCFFITWPNNDQTVLIVTYSLSRFHFVGEYQIKHSDLLGFNQHQQVPNNFVHCQHLLINKLFNHLCWWCGMIVVSETSPRISIQYETSSFFWMILHFESKFLNIYTISDVISGAFHLSSGITWFWYCSVGLFPWLSFVTIGDFAGTFNYFFLLWLHNWWWKLSQILLLLLQMLHIVYIYQPLLITSRLVESYPTCFVLMMCWKMLTFGT